MMWLLICLERKICGTDSRATTCYIGGVWIIMKKYEYKVEEYSAVYSLEDDLNKEGEDGWRCINILRNDGHLVLVFERKYEEQ